MEMNSQKIEELGGKPGTGIRLEGVMRYVTGCIKRERKRVAEAVRAGGRPEEIAERILSEQYDDRVFRFTGPESAYTVLD